MEETQRGWQVYVCPHGVRDDGWVLASQHPMAGGGLLGEVARRVPCCHGAGWRDDHLRAHCHAQPWWGFIQDFLCLSAGSETQHCRQQGALPMLLAEMERVVVTWVYFGSG